jgi:hypothetical protein
LQPGSGFFVLVDKAEIVVAVRAIELQRICEKKKFLLGFFATAFPVAFGALDGAFGKISRRENTVHDREWIRVKCP